MFFTLGKLMPVYGRCEIIFAKFEKFNFWQIFKFNFFLNLGSFSANFEKFFSVEK